MDIYDDGTGFDPAAVPARPDGSGYGLTSLRERVAALHGRLDIESAPGEGTVVAIRLPLATTPSADAGTSDAGISGTGISDTAPVQAGGAGNE
jgi:signal transduction histidine kinase